MSERSNPQSQVICVPFNMDEYDIVSLEGFVHLLIDQYPPEEFAFHMAMYSRFEPQHLSKEEYKIMFCAKDTWGAQVYSVYRHVQGKGKDTMFHYPMDSDNFDAWVHDTDFKDDYLAAAVNMYHTLLSFRQLKLHA